MKNDCEIDGILLISQVWKLRLGKDIQVRLTHDSLNGFLEYKK